MDQEKNPPFTQEDQLQSRCQTDCLGRRGNLSRTFYSQRWLFRNSGNLGSLEEIGVFQDSVFNNICVSSRKFKDFFCGCSILLVEEILHHLAFFKHPSVLMMGFQLPTSTGFLAGFLVAINTLGSVDSIFWGNFFRDFCNVLRGKPPQMTPRKNDKMDGSFGKETQLLQQNLYFRMSFGEGHADIIN